MAMLIEGGADAFNALIYPRPHANTMAFFNNQRGSLADIIAPQVQTFYNNVSAHFQRLDDSEALRLARAAMRAVDNIWNYDGVMRYDNIGQFQNASLEMQRWIMAEPLTRRLFIRGACEGFEGSYVDTEPGRIGDAHIDYRLVTNGVCITNNDGTMSATTWAQDLRPTDRELLWQEQVDVMATWRVQTLIMAAAGDDPTSRWNSSL